MILFEPAYDSYIPAIELAGATPAPLPLQVPGYSIDWDAVRRALSPRTRMIVLNTPNNPGTSVLTSEDVAMLAAITRDRPIVVVSDEVYEHMVYDGAAHQSITRHAELAGRSVVIGSFDKTFHATCWKVGYTLAPPALTAEIRRVHQFTVFTSTARHSTGWQRSCRIHRATNRRRRSSNASETCCARHSRIRRSNSCRVGAATSSSRVTTG